MSKHTHPRTAARLRRHRRVRKRVRGVPDSPRLCVYRSNRYLYAQVIDDVSGRTIAAASTRDASVTAGKTASAAASLGKTVAERARAVGVTTVVFDRGGARFHGRIKALADAAREAGLEF